MCNIEWWIEAKRSEKVGRNEWRRVRKERMGVEGGVKEGCG